MDYEKLPKIDMNDIDKNEFKNMFSYEYRMPFGTHYITYQKQEIPIGKSSIMIDHRSKTVEWLTFFPFNNIVSKEETEKDLSEELMNKFLKENLATIEKEYPTAKEYAVIDIVDIAQNKIVPGGFIRNYKRKGIGALAHTQILERILFSYGDNINNYKIIHDSANKQRLKHLKAIGLTPLHNIFFTGTEIKEPFHEYLEKSRAYLKSKGIY